MRPSVPGCSAAASRNSSSVSDSPAVAVSTDPWRPRSLEPAGHAGCAHHAGGVDARHQAGALRQAGEVALLERCAVGRAQPDADLVVARAAFRQSLDRLQQDFHALGCNRLGNARELRIEHRRCARPTGMCRCRRPRRRQCAEAGCARSETGRRAAAPAVSPRMVRAVVSSAATERPIMASASLAGAMVDSWSAS